MAYERGIYGSESIPGPDNRDAIDAACCLELLRTLRGVSFATVTDEGLPSIRIIDACTGCGTCASCCPQSCIHEKDDGKYEIDQGACLGCGYCEEVCPAGAIEKRGAKPCLGLTT